MQFGTVEVHNFSWINKKLTVLGWPIDVDHSSHGEALVPETHKKDYVAGFTVDDIAEDFYALYLTSQKYKRDTSIQLKVNAQSGNWIIGLVDYQTGDMDITTNHKYPEEAKMIAHFKEGIALFLERIKA